MEGGEVFILKMPRVRVGDLVEILIEAYAPQFGYRPDEIAVETIGRRSGEKAHEALMTLDEAGRAEEVQGMYVVSPTALPSDRAAHGAADEPAILDRSDVRSLLDAAGWLQPALLPSMG
jgi:UDP-N-acetylglucosamine 4,6-dehydratase/5-epimerase